MKFEKHIEMLEDSLPKQFDDGIDIKGNRDIKEFQVNLKMNLNGTTLGKTRFKLICAVYQYRRKRARWISNMNSVMKMMKPYGKKLHES